ncbi:MAG: hypothetical protein Q9214_006050, partial [Letrouitia sp. 1 TL-2023]
YTTSVLGILFYFLLNWSYTTAIITSPGSTVSADRFGYSHLPSHEPPQDHPSFTVKSTGATRFCKKCQARKPDRAHHCSTCQRCVLKMDHHCPWLATCVGLRNYKPFLLFLVYTTLFCWVCFGVTGTWLWKEVLSDGRYEETLMPVNYVLLCTIAGIIGLVLTGFTGWHLSLAWRNQTTIECLEKTRYLSPLRRSMRQQLGSSQGQSYGQQLAEIHANAIPGATRDEEGEEERPPSPMKIPRNGSAAQRSLHMNYESMERSREQERYEEYLDEKDSEKLPNAFDLGWRQNLRNLFGDKPLLWVLPICNSVGDGWHWEPSAHWVEAREGIRRQREAEWGNRQDRGSRIRHHHAAPSNGFPGARGGKADRVLGRPPDSYIDGNPDNESPSSDVSMKTLRRRESFDNVSRGNMDEDEDNEYSSSSDEEARAGGWQGMNHRIDGSVSGTDDWRKQD